MAYISRQDYLKMQESKPAKKTGENGKSIWNFRLKDDGDEAVVRFAYQDPSDIQILTVHSVQEGNRFKKVNCTNDFKSGINTCPLCAQGVKLQNRVFVKLIEYVRAEDGSLKPYARIWDRPATFSDTLVNLFTEYGDLSDCVFKVKRKGVAGDKQVDYDIMFGNPSIYNKDLYVKDFSAFDGYEVIGNNVEEQVAPQGQTFTPATESSEPENTVTTQAMPRRVQY